MRGTFCAPFLHHVESLHHHRIEAHARQHHSPPRYGQEKGRRRPARDQNGAASVRAEPAPASDLGARAEKIHPHSRDCARTEDDQQKRRLQSAEKSWRDLIWWIAFSLTRLTRSENAFHLASADFRFFFGRARPCRVGRRGERLFFWF